MKAAQWSEWPTVAIAELGDVITGRTPPSSRPECFGDRYPFITPSDMDGRKFMRMTERSLSEEGAGLLKSNRIPPGCVTVSCIGWQMGKTAVTAEVSCTNQQLNTIRPRADVSVDFLYYSLLLRRDKLLSLGASTGVRTPILNKTAFSQLRIPIPPLPVQRRIASILDAYDDLIENNLRRIKILEQMAQTIYREWFVEFRAPGVQLRKATAEEKKVTGKNVMPKGWEVKKLGDICRITMGQSPPSTAYNQVGKGLPFHQGATDFGDLFPTDRTYCTMTNRLAEEGDILLSVRAPVGRINVATNTKRIVIGRGVAALRFLTDEQALGLLQIKEKFKEEDMMGGGTIFKSVTKDDVHGIRLLCPDGASRRVFEDRASTMIVEIRTLTVKNGNLRGRRDLLLPKLVSGEIAA